MDTNYFINLSINKDYKPSFKNKRIAYFGFLEYMTVTEFIEILDDVKAKYVKSYLDYTIDYLVLSDKMYNYYTKNKYMSNNSFKYIDLNITVSKGRMNVISESMFLEICNRNEYNTIITPKYIGKMIFSPLKDYIVTGLISTGFDYVYDELVQICALKVHNHEIVDKFIYTICPLNEISNRILNHYNISNKEYILGNTLEEGMIKYINFIGDLPIISSNAYLKNEYLFYKYYTATLKTIHNNYCDIMILSSNVFPNTKTSFKNIMKFLSIKDTIYDENLLVNTCMKFFYIYEALIKKPSYMELTQYEFNPFKNRNFHLEGMFETINRKKVTEIITKCGGKVTTNITYSLKYLILSNDEYINYINNNTSKKQKRVINFNTNGKNIQVISENIFNYMLYHYNLERIHSKYRNY